MMIQQESIREFRRNLRSLERLIELSLADQTECCGVTPAQCHVLLETGASGQSSIGDLAGALQLDASTLSRTVDGLVQAGLLERREDPENRRRSLVSLAQAGEEKVAYINKVCDAYYTGLLGTLPAEDRSALLGLLPRFVALLRDWQKQASACCRSDPDGGSCLP